jgi:hypothetical protein
LLLRYSIAGKSDRSVLLFDYIAPSGMSRSLATPLSRAHFSARDSGER